MHESATAAKTLSPFVRMPQGQHGSRKAIEHWRGFRGSPLEQNQKRPTWAGVLRKVIEMPGRDEMRARKEPKTAQGLPVIRRNVAGIDLGSERHWVCAPTLDGSGREIASFGATTAELIRMAEWLKARQVESVAMESTGVYWIAPHEVLEAQGLQVLLVDTRQLAQVPGRDKKTDPTDCEWIQRLHSCGLLRVRSGRRKRCACCGRWCGIRRTWWRRVETGCGGCKRVWTR